VRFNIGSLEVGDGLPCALVAELSNNANGNFENAIRLLDAAKESGASAAKLQCYTPEELIALRGDGTPPPPWDGMSMRELYLRAMTPRKWFPDLFKHAHNIGLPLFSSVFGTESLALLEDCGCPAYKVSSFERDQAPLRKAVQETGKPWIVSRPDYAEPNVPTLWCPVGYPQMGFDLEDMERGGFFGFSYHGISTAIPSWSATLYGAKMVEVHVQLDEEPSELEAGVSLRMSQLKLMSEHVRASEKNRKAA
jgi:pseudaminic acid synthase